MSTSLRFDPGDVVRFTVVKIGLHRNFASLKPKNNDSVRIILSAPCAGTATVTDFDGNVYITVQIGTQCWLKENMHAKHYSYGTALVYGTGVGNIYGDVLTPFAGTSQGICPDGWHVSTSGDWCLMDKFLDSTYTDYSYPNLYPGPLGFWSGTQIRN